MARKIIYRTQILKAVEALLEGTPAASLRAQHILERCNSALCSDEKYDTLDHFIWRCYISPLRGDSVYYENKEYLQEVRDFLLGKSLQNISKMVYALDYSKDFTADEAEWHRLLMSMIDILSMVPFTQISQAIAQNQQSIKDWKTTFESLPEAALIVKIDEEYQQKKALVREILIRNPSPEDIGDEKIYHLVLREITSLLSEININIRALYLGYPVLGDQNTTYMSFTDIHEFPDITENVLWAKKTLEALTGNGAFFISWRLNKAYSFHTDVLVISLH